MGKVFDHPVLGKDAAKCLLILSVAEYSVEFQTLAANLGWNDESLQGVLLNALSDPVQDDFAVRDNHNNLDSLISLATSLDNCL